MVVSEGSGDQVFDDPVEETAVSIGNSLTGGLKSPLENSNEALVINDKEKE